MVNSKLDLIDYCKRKLGSPVIHLELDDNQVFDRVDDAVLFYQDIHYDGTEKVFLKHQITGNTILVVDSSGFMVGETIVTPSGTKFELVKKEGNILHTKKFEGQDVIATDVLSGTQSGWSTLATSVIIGDIQNQFLKVPDEIIGVIRILPFKDNQSGNNYIQYAFDPKYQIMVTELHNLANNSVVYYSQLMQHMAELDFQLRPLDSVRFNRNTDRIYIEYGWDKVQIGEYFVIECFRAVNPESFTEMYNDRLFKELATAMIKKQWGSNLKKFDGVQMIGGVTINGQQIFDEAVNEQQAIEEKIRSGFELPPIGFLG